MHIPPPPPPFSLEEALWRDHGGRGVTQLLGDLSAEMEIALSKEREKERESVEEAAMAVWGELAGEAGGGGEAEGKRLVGC